MLNHRTDLIPGSNDAAYDFPSRKTEKSNYPIEEMPEDIVPDEVPRRDGPGGESGTDKLR